MRGAIAGLTAMALLLPAAVAGADPQEKLEQVDERLDEARERLDEVEEQRGHTLEDLEEINARHAVLQGQLAEAQQELRDAEWELNEAEARLQATTEELEATEDELAATREELAEKREIFAARARAAYKRPSVGLSTALLDLDEAHDVARALGYSRRVLAEDRDRIELVAGLERQVRAQAELLAELQEREAAERAVAAERRDEVAELVAAQKALHDEVAAAAAEHRAVLTELEADKETYTALVDDLEAESARLEEELRRRAEEERRRRAAAAERRREEAEAAQRRAARSDGDPSASAGDSGRFHRPAQGPMTSGYGYRTHPIHGGRRFHSGLDFGGALGAPITAASGGVVVSAGWRGGYGNTVVIDHGNGLATLYAHQSQIAVSSGQRVSRGDLVGRVGSTGYSTGPHLHFEVRVDGSPRDPRGYL